MLGMPSISTQHVLVLMKTVQCREVTMGLRKKSGVEGSSKWYLAVFAGPRRKDPQMTVPCPRAYCQFTLMAKEPENSLCAGE